MAQEVGEMKSERKVVESQRRPKLKPWQKNVFGLLDPSALTNRERKTKASFQKKKKHPNSA